MKKLYLFFASCLMLSFTSKANNTENTTYTQKPFIFVENGIEFAVFNNGEFDFSIVQHNRANFNISTRNINLSFNTGNNYEPYIQQDGYGFITQINNTPIFYNINNKVSRIGNILINYNYRGLISNIGNLNISYNNYGVAYHQRGYINTININYNPRYLHYKRPVKRRTTVVYNTPSRRNYNKFKYVNKSTNKRSRNNYKTNKYNSKYYNNKKYNKDYSKGKYNKGSYNKSKNNSSKKEKQNTAKQSYRQNSNSYRKS